MEGDTKETLLSSIQDDNNYRTEEENLKDKIWNEKKKIWRVAGPAIFTRFSTFGVNVVSQAFIGHIGATELAAFALVFTVLIRFANGLLLGMASGLETLCGQAYGASQYHMLGVYLQRSWIVLIITATLITPIFIFAAPILKALGQDENIADVAGTISLWFIPAMYSFVVSFSCQMYLQAQSKNMIITYLAAFSLGTHIFLSWLLTVQYKFGIIGVLVSTILAYWIPNVGQLIFIVSGGCRETWKGFTTLAFTDLWPVVKLSLSSGAMLWLGWFSMFIFYSIFLKKQDIDRNTVASILSISPKSAVFHYLSGLFLGSLELWYNSILILLTGNLKNAEVAIDALSICLNINGWEMMISLGFLAAASVRISNELGKGDSKAAKFSIMIIVLTSFVIGFTLFIFFLFFRERLAYIFTNSPDVAVEVADLSPLLAFSMLMNSIQPVLSGVAVGAGLQSIVVYVNLASYYLIGIPVGIVFGYALKLQVKGVWIGMLIGTLVQTIILLIITYRTDWDKQVSIAKQRVNKWLVKVEPNDDSSGQA